jgi:all-trans-retinol 13,14-reductase
MITAVWTGIYLINVVLFLLLAVPFPIICCSILIGCGIAFSIVFPLKAPAYLVSREFKKYDWSAEANVQKPKEDNEYDVIIVGSGIGGLTCGSLLSKREVTRFWSWSSIIWSVATALPSREKDLSSMQVLKM